MRLTPKYENNVNKIIGEHVNIAGDEESVAELYSELANILGKGLF